MSMHYSPIDVKFYLKSPLDLKDAKLQCVIVQDEILAFLTEWKKTQMNTTDEKKAGTSTKTRGILS